MNEVDKLTTRVRKLPEKDLARFRDWFIEFEHQQWDRQIAADFWALYRKLPVEIRELADKNYELLKANPHHPSLHLKRIEELSSVRIGQHYRAVGIDAAGGIQWIWIGSHADYDVFIS